jgi:hypothetical protein
MYPWDTKPPAPRDGADPVTKDAVTPDQATQAVQVALDRRDNGGDADQ